MRLKRLVLQGYKTFATKTEFVFDEGITSIVGPNGSGKSNIADAVRWVLGEQSYTTLRGKRSTDMIFTGSRTRARAGMASVILTLDNSDGWLPIDYTEVEIGRRTFRSGENEYILNGQKVRLKDITELLSTSGLAERTYTIVGQGLVDQALSLRAEERRALFEEAAGISYYKAKRTQTIRRLDETQRNLERVNDILSEIRPRLASLKRQATRARNYEQVAADLRQMLRIWYGHKWELAKDEMRRARETSSTVEATWQESRQQMQLHQDKIDEQRRLVNQLQQQISRTDLAREEIREKLERFRRQVAVLQERQASAERQLDEIARDRPGLEQQRIGAQQEVAQAVAEQGEAESVFQGRRKELEQFDKSRAEAASPSQSNELRKQRKNASDRRQRLIGDLKRLRRESYEHDQKLNKLRNTLARLEARADLLFQVRHRDIKIGPDVGIIGRFSGLITIPGQYETAVEAALRTHLAAVVVPGASDIWQLLRGSEPKESWSAVAVNEISPPAVLPTPDDPAIIDWAVNLAASGPTMRPLAQLLLGQVLIVKDDVQAAFRLAQSLPAGAMVVTVSGFVAHAGGLVERHARDAGSSILRDEAEWQQAEAEVKKLRQEVSRSEAIAVKRQTDIEANQNDADELRAEEDRLGQLVNEANQQEILGQQQRQIFQQNVHAAQSIVAGRRAVVDSRRGTLRQIENQLNSLRVRQESLQKQQQQMALAAEESQVTDFRQQLETMNAQLVPLKQKLDQGRKALFELEDEASLLRKKTHQNETQYTQVKIAFSQKQTQVEALQERIKADLGIVSLSYDEDQTGPTPLPMDEVVELLPRVDELPRDIEESIQNYRGQMQRMGAINPDAPEEYEETNTRYEFLGRQVEDLQQTELQLHRVIKELDELTSRAFVETVEKVNEVFGTTFTQLFGGGSARLDLTDPDDLTNSGVDIIARLPNRREQALALLSGGERSLTAVALIFSLLKVSPTPFCVMDEVDAALDEANVNRFRDLLRQLSVNTQFIVITHNRGTVQVAQTLYGISMSTDSTSQAISIRPEEYVKQESLV